MDMRATRATLKRAREALGHRFVVFRDAGTGRQVARLTEDRAVTAFFATMDEGGRLPESWVAPLASADEGGADLTGVLVRRAREQMTEREEEQRKGLEDDAIG
jgi:hypothetical protein